MFCTFVSIARKYQCFVMCVNKILIKNKKLDFNPVVDRFFNYVPCGKCGECRQQLVNGYTTRLLAQYEDSKKNGFDSFYFTLTYDSLHLPKFFDKPCFHIKDCQNFFKCLRKHLSKYDLNFKYFLSSEYGQNTIRPHYHLVVFLSGKIYPQIFQTVVQKAWRFGVAYFGYNNGLIVDSRPFSYVSKYICKDLFITKIQNEYSEDLIKAFATTGFNFGYRLFPFHLQSNGLGKALCNKITDDDLIKGSIVFTSSLGISKSYQIPLYCYRQLVYDTYKNVNGNISYKLNSRGLAIFKRRVLYQKKRLLESLEVINSYIPVFAELDGIKKHICQKYADLIMHRADSNFRENFVNWLLLYRDNNFVPFTYSNFVKDIDIYLDTIKLPQFVLDKSVFTESHMYNEGDYVRYLDFISSITQYLKYDVYVKNQENYNIKNLNLFLISHKFKPVYVESFNEFVNINNSNPCLITFLNFKKLNSTKDKEAPFECSVPLLVESL